MPHAPGRRGTLERVEDASHERLEMLLVARWLDAGAPGDGAVALSVPEVASELGLPEERSSVLVVMAALGELEARQTIGVEWPGGPGGEARVTLASDVRRDARRLFGA